MIIVFRFLINVMLQKLMTAIFQPVNFIDHPKYCSPVP